MTPSYHHYISQLKERRPEIADFLLCCERDHLTAQDYRAMRNCVHSLLALGKQHDTRLHALAETMCDALEENNPAIRINLISLARALLMACHEALITIPAIERKPVSLPRLLNGSHGKPTLLSVDDDRIIGEIMRSLFGAHANVLTAPDGVEGLRMIRERKPDLVLLDDAMPRMTGMKLLETLQGDPELSCLSVIMVTSSDREQDVARATAAGAVDYVIKPFNPESLQEKVYMQLEKKAALK